ncbi:nuclear transport factor 2 family protein [Flavobacterium sp.]|uniref:nuclear transport factor 2 family protein n=1 Tax=Flavobacterium sp. TaxID=239 RepID=UPI003D6B3D0B
MRKITLLLIFCFSLNGNAQQTDIKKTITTFFDGFHAKDTVKIKSVCHDKMILQSIVEGVKSNRLAEEKTSEFYKSFAQFPPDLKFEEKIFGYTIQIDGAMAHAWTPYEFYINGKLSHSGVNAFTLFKENDTWKIIYIIDTRRK